MKFLTTILFVIPLAIYAQFTPKMELKINTTDEPYIVTNRDSTAIRIFRKTNDSEQIEYCVEFLDNNLKSQHIELLALPIKKKGDFEGMLFASNEEFAYLYFGLKGTDAKIFQINRKTQRLKLMDIKLPEKTTAVRVELIEFHQIVFVRYASVLIQCDFNSNTQILQKDFKGELEKVYDPSGNRVELAMNYKSKRKEIMDVYDLKLNKVNSYEFEEKIGNDFPGEYQLVKSSAEMYTLYGSYFDDVIRTHPQGCFTAKLANGSFSAYKPVPYTSLKNFKKGLRNYALTNFEKNRAPYLQATIKNELMFGKDRVYLISDIKKMIPNSNGGAAKHSVTGVVQTFSPDGELLWDYAYCTQPKWDEDTVVGSKLNLRLTTVQIHSNIVEANRLYLSSYVGDGYGRVLELNDMGEVLFEKLFKIGGVKNYTIANEFSLRQVQWWYGRSYLMTGPFMGKTDDKEFLYMWRYEH